MWYKIAAQGRVVDRFQNIENIINNALQNSKYTTPEGVEKVDFTKFNSMMPPEINNYISSFKSTNDPRSLGMFVETTGTMLLPEIYDANTYGTILHELAHAIHKKDLTNLKSQYSEILQDEPWTPKRLKSVLTRYPTYQEYQNRSRDFESGIELMPDEMEIAKQISTRIKPSSSFYYATNDEMLAYFENAVQFFSGQNLLKVYQKYFNNPYKYLNFLRETFGTISIYKDEDTNEKKFKGITPKLRKLISMIVDTTGEDPGALKDIVDAKWWSQLSKQINNNFNTLQNLLIEPEKNK